MSSGDNYVADGPAQIGWSTGMERLEVSLPHQCGEWIIGDIDHVRVMIADLTALLPEFEHPEKYRHPHVCIECTEAFIGAGGTCSFSCSARQRQGLCETCSAAHWTKRAAVRRAAEREKLRSFPDAGVE